MPPTPSPPLSTPSAGQTLLRELPEWLQSPWAIALIASLGMHALFLAWISQPRNQQGLNQQSAPVKVVELPSSALSQLPATVIGGGTLPGPTPSLGSPSTTPLTPLSPSVFAGPAPTVLKPTPPAGFLSLQPLSLLPSLLPPPPPLGLDELPSRTVAKAPPAKPKLKIPAPPTTTPARTETAEEQASEPGQEADPASTSTASQEPTGQAGEQAANPSQEAGTAAKPSDESPTAAAPRRPQLAYESVLTSAVDVAQQREVFLAQARKKLDQAELALPPARLQNLSSSGAGCFDSKAQPVEFMALVDGDGKPMIPTTLVQSSGYPELDKEGEALINQQALPRPGQPYLLRVSLKFSPPKDCPTAAG